MATSERRITRSQARTRIASSASASASASICRSSAKKPLEGTPSPAIASRSPSLMSKEARIHGDGGAMAQPARRILADLAGNDSPVVGLLPSSASQKSRLNPNSQPKPKSRRALLGSAPKETATPIGESLLRSQVQKLLQKDSLRSQTASPSPSSPSPTIRRSLSLICGSASSNPSAPNEAMESSAPTPRMPSATLSRLSDGDHHRPSLSNANPQELSYSKTLRGISITESVRSGCDTRVLQLTPLVTTDQIVENAIARTTVADEKDLLQLTPLISEVVDVAIATDVFLGKRILQFDSPDKGSEAIHHQSGIAMSVNQELDDLDGASEWSVNVNVGSPEAEMEAPAERELDFTDGDDCTARLLAFEEHVQKMQKQLSVSKLDLLWDREDLRTPLSEEEDDDDGDGDGDEDGNGDEHGDGDEDGNGDEHGDGDEDGDDETRSSASDSVFSTNNKAYSKANFEEESDEKELLATMSTSNADALGIRQLNLSREEDRSDRLDDVDEGEEEEEPESEEGDSDDDEGRSVNNLCLQFSRTSLIEDQICQTRLPRGQGTHLRFLYKNEISEAMVVKGEEAMGGTTIKLRGLPAHQGRHWRFTEDEEEEDDDDDDDEA